MAPRGLVLTNEAGLRRTNPSWALVEHVVRELDPGLGNSHCCLETPGGSFVQTLRGFNGYHLERRLRGGDGVLRAGYPGSPARAARLVKYDYGNDGEAGDLLYCDDVVDAFRDFYQGRMGGGWLDWRLLDL